MKKLCFAPHFYPLIPFGLLVLSVCLAKQMVFLPLATLVGIGILCRSGSRGLLPALGILVAALSLKGLFFPGRSLALLLSFGCSQLGILWNFALALDEVEYLGALLNESLQREVETYAKQVRILEDKIQEHRSESELAMKAWEEKWKNKDEEICRYEQLSQMHQEELLEANAEKHKALETSIVNYRKVIQFEHEFSQLEEKIKTLQSGIQERDQRIVSLTHEQKKVDQNNNADKEESKEKESSPDNPLASQPLPDEANLCDERRLLQLIEERSVVKERYEAIVKKCTAKKKSEEEKGLLKEAKKALQEKEREVFLLKRQLAFQN